MRPEEEEHLEQQWRTSEGRDALGVRIEVLAIFLFRNFSQCFPLDDFALRTILKSTFHSSTRYWEALATSARVARPIATTTVQLASSDMNPVPITVSNSANDCIDEQVVSQGAGTGGPICYYHRKRK